MPTIYAKTDLPELGTLMRRRFAELHDAGVTVCVLFAANEDGPAVKHGGNPCAAKVQVTSLPDRVRGIKDVKLTIDKSVWYEKTDRQREALLAHELTHLVVRREKSGAVKTDDANRPKLGTIPDDYTINGFYSVAEHYRDDAHERQTLGSVVRQYEQRGLFDDAEPAALAGVGGKTATVTLTGEQAEAAAKKFKVHRDVNLGGPLGEPEEMTADEFIEEVGKKMRA